MPESSIRKQIQTIDASRKAAYLVLIGARRLYLLTQVHLITDGTDDEGHPQSRERDQTRRESVVETNDALDVEIHTVSRFSLFCPALEVRLQWHSNRAARNGTAPLYPCARGGR